MHIAYTHGKQTRRSKTEKDEGWNTRILTRPKAIIRKLYKKNELEEQGDIQEKATDKVEQKIMTMVRWETVIKLRNSVNLCKQRNANTLFTSHA